MRVPYEAPAASQPASQSLIQSINQSINQSIDRLIDQSTRTILIMTHITTRTEQIPKTVIPGALNCVLWSGQLIILSSP